MRAPHGMSESATLTGAVASVHATCRSVNFRNCYAKPSCNRANLTRSLFRIPQHLYRSSCGRFRHDFSLIDWRDSGEHMTTLTVIGQIVTFMLCDRDLTWNSRYLFNILRCEEIWSVRCPCSVCHVVQVVTL